VRSARRWRVRNERSLRAICARESLGVVIEPLTLPADADVVVSFLPAHEWPFHGVPQLTPVAATSVQVAGEDILSFWIRDDDEAVGLIRHCSNLTTSTMGVRCSICESPRPTVGAAWDGSP